MPYTPNRHFLFSLVAVLFGASPWALGDNSASQTSPGGLFRLEYQKLDLSFCNGSVCVDFDGDGSRELLFASRKTDQLQMLRGADGKVLWSKTLAGDQQSISAYDLDGDSDFEILYTVSGPGRMYVLDHEGQVQQQWDADDWKLGNSAVVLDSDGDGLLEGFFGTRSRYLIRLNMTDLSLVQRRGSWVQCGCHTSAMDVDGDGRWDLFAGSGDDSSGKGVLHRYDPATLKTVWSFRTDDNASSADPVLVDIDGDSQVEIIKSVDNYRGDDAHDAVYAFETDGTLIWKHAGLAGEDSPNAFDLDGDGEVEVVGMTFGCEVYCLNAQGKMKWRKDLRPELSDHDAHAYLTPILVDVNGDHQIEILALTNGGYFDAAGKPAAGRSAAPGVVFALSASGEVLDRFAIAGHRYWGDAFVANIDDDPFLELVVTGSGGLDVIQTRGFGPDTEHFQRRRNYQRLNVVPWAYEDSFFVYRGTKDGVRNRTDNLVLVHQGQGYGESGSFTTQLLRLPPNGRFGQLKYLGRTPANTKLTVNILDRNRRRIRTALSSGANLGLTDPVHLEFVLSTADRSVTPTLDAYSLSFQRREAGSTSFVVDEATIAGIHRAFESGQLTAVKLVDNYLDRIAKFDAPNDLKAFVVLNPNARHRAATLDAEFAKTGKLRPLHGIPVVVKDNYDTHDLQTAGGSVALTGSLPPDDSSMVQRIRAAGAIVIGKSNMDEWAFSPLKTVSSILGTTRNPYDLQHVPAGSSGGTAASVAANLGAVGLGTDTGNSIRGPSAHCALVGIRPTIGLTSRDGIIPLSLTADVGGPMCRTVEDAARVLSVVAGYDLADPATYKIKGTPAVDYTRFLDRHGLRGARIGVLRSYFEPQQSDPEVIGLMEQSLKDLKRMGAKLHDPFIQPALPHVRRRDDPSFRSAVNFYLASLGRSARFRTLGEIVAAGKYHPALEKRLSRVVRGPAPNLDRVQLAGPDGDPAREAFRSALVEAMNKHQLDAIIYPTWRYAPRKIGDVESPHGDNNQVLAPRTGMPALTVPMGYTRGSLPAGLQFLGRPFDEGRLIRLAFAYEQGTKHRRPPAGFTADAR